MPRRCQKMPFSIFPGTWIVLLLSVWVASLLCKDSLFPLGSNETSTGPALWCRNRKKEDMLVPIEFEVDTWHSSGINHFWVSWKRECDCKDNMNGHLFQIVWVNKKWNNWRERQWDCSFVGIIITSYAEQNLLERITQKMESGFGCLRAKTAGAKSLWWEEMIKLKPSERMAFGGRKAISSMDSLWMIFTKQKPS